MALSLLSIARKSALVQYLQIQPIYIDFFTISYGLFSVSLVACDFSRHQSILSAIINDFGNRTRIFGIPKHFSPIVCDISSDCLGLMTIA